LWRKLCRLKFSFKAFLFISLAWIPTILFGQDKIIHHGTVWLRYYNQSKVSEKLTLHFELEERVLLNPLRQFQLFTHLHLHYQAKRWLDIAAGGNYNQSNSARFPDLAVPEFRPWQEMTMTKTFASAWQFQFRYRLDWRFIHNNAAGELTDGYFFYMRHRIRFQLYRELKKFSNEKALAFRLSEEVMMNTGSNASDTFDQNRLYSSLEYRFNNHWSVEAGYLNLFQSRNSDDGYFDRHTMRVTVYHKLDFRKEK
jgi:Protein of unknown function (DUF2490)